MAKNRVVHFEIGSEDPKKLSEFYRKALGWEINEWPGSNYWIVGKEADRAVGAINGGIMKRFENEKTINTIETDDLDATIKAVTDNGGKTIKPKASMPMGEQTMWWCYVADPDGNVFGLMQMVPSTK
jgi:predicted enzyme related to lactoylglutathione lyase